MRLRYSLALSALVGLPAAAASLDLSVEIPRLNVAEYHRPYVAMWIERADGSQPKTLAVWYDIRNKGGNADGEGTKWLKDLRQWWRRIGRELQMPVDGVSAATRPAAKHQLAFNEAAIGPMAAGAYKLQVEAAREGGGRELLSLPFEWPPKPNATQTVAGTSELGEVRFEFKP